MEALSCLLKRAIEGNYLSGSKVDDKEEEELVISHLLYVDDSYFAKATKSS